jgi:four helix bundle protein
MSRTTTPAGDAGIRSYRDLRVWQQSIDLVEAIYQLTANWPQRESYGLTQQIRRAAVSVPSNIAEGQGRHGGREFLHALSIANGSLYELETQLLIAQRLRYVSVEEGSLLLDRTAQIGRLLYGLMRRLQSSTTPASNRGRQGRPSDDRRPTTDDHMGEM